MRRRALALGLLGVIASVSPVRAAGELAQMWFGVKAAAGNGVTHYASTDVTETGTDVTKSEFVFPTSGCLRNMEVQCAGAPGGSASWRVRSWIGGNFGNLDCTLGSGDKGCADLTDTDAFTGASTKLTFSVLTTGSATAANCVIAVQATASCGSTGAHNPAIMFGDATAASPIDDRYGAPSTTAATQHLNSAVAVAGIVVPTGITVTGLCVSLNSNPTGAKTETYHLFTAGADSSSLVTTLDNSHNPNCVTGSVDVSAGSVISVHFNRTGTAESKTRLVTLEYTGGGGWIGSGAPWATSTKYFTMQEGTNTSASTLPQRVSQSGVIRNLRAVADAYPTPGQVVTLFTGATSSVSSTALSLTIPIAPTPAGASPTPTLAVQSDVTHEILVHQGDFLNTEIKTAGSTAHTTMWGYEFVPNGKRYAVAVGTETPTPSAWSSHAHWSFTSGGSAGPPLPTTLDDCILDGSSFSTSPSTLILDTDATCGTLTTTGYTQTMAMDGHTLSLSGDLTSGAGTMWSSTGGALTLSGSGSVTSNGAALPDLVVTGTYSLSDTLTTLGHATWGIDVETTGDFNTNGNTISTSSLHFGLGSLELGTSIVHLNGASTVLNLVYSFTSTFDAGTSTLSIERDTGGARAVSLPWSLTLYKLAVTTMDTVNVTILGGGSGLTLTELDMPANGKITFQAGRTTTLTSGSSLTGSGTAGQEIKLWSSSSSGQTTISGSADVNISYWDLQKINWTGGHTLTCTCCSDSGGNTAHLHPTGDTHTQDVRYARKCGREIGRRQDDPVGAGIEPLKRTRSGANVPKPSKRWPISTRWIRTPSCSSNTMICSLRTRRPSASR